MYIYIYIHIFTSLLAARMLRPNSVLPVGTAGQVYMNIDIKIYRYL